jgi:alcohol dehydrogenase (cytochrome c)
MKKIKRGSQQFSFTKRMASVVAAASLLSAIPLSAQAGSDWALPFGHYSGNAYINENQITNENIGRLQHAWTFKLPDNAPTETSPIEANGRVYITSAHDQVYALNAETGKLEWKFDAHPHQLVGFPRNRGVAILNGKVFMATEDGHIIALNANTGRVVWNKLEVHNPKNSFYTMQPVPYRGELIVGVSNGDWGGIGNISAFSPTTGERLWQWNTVPGPGQPGHDTWSGDSWKRGGAASWHDFAIDPATGTLYADLGNPQPDLFGSLRKGANLYSDSMVALDISGKTPRLKWYHQFIPHDTHDEDPAMPPVLFTGVVHGKKMRLVAAGDKAGNFWVLNAETGKLVHHLAVSYQYHQKTPPSLKGSITCPTLVGGIEFNGGAYDPTTNTFFVPSTSSCGLWKGFSKAVYVAGQFYLGGGIPSPVGPTWGWFNAINMNTGVFAWRHYFEEPENGGALVLSHGANSLVFTGLLTGEFEAFDTRSGKLLWHYDTDASIIAPPASYVAGGHRYLVVASGNPGFFGPGLFKTSKTAVPRGPAVLTAFVEK